MKWKFEKKYFRWGFIALIVIIVGITFNYLLLHRKEMAVYGDTIKNTMWPIILGCVLAYLLNPILNFFENYCFIPVANLLIRKPNKEQSKKKFARALGILCTIIFLLVIIVGGFYLVIPQVYQSLLKIVTDAPGYYDQVQLWINSLNGEKSEISRYILMGLDEAYAQGIHYLNTNILPNMDKIVANITSGIVGGLKILFNLVLALIISVYVMAGKEDLISVLKKLVYSIFNTANANAILRGMRYASRVFGGFVNGKLVDSFIIGAICYGFMMIVGLDYAVLISIVIGLTNIIPYFGPIIGAVPSTLILLMVEPKQGVIFVIFVVILQQIDGNILGPVILGDRLKLSSMWILFSILVGGGLFGVLGMILGAPCFACIYTLVSTICRKRLEGKQLPTDTNLYYKLESVVYEDGINRIQERMQTESETIDTKKKQAVADDSREES